MRDGPSTLDRCGRERAVAAKSRRCDDARAVGELSVDRDQIRRQANPDYLQGRLDAVEYVLQLLLAVRPQLTDMLQQHALQVEAEHRAADDGPRKNRLEGELRQARQLLHPHGALRSVAWAMEETH